MRRLHHTASPETFCSVLGLIPPKSSQRGQQIQRARRLHNRRRRRARLGVLRAARLRRRVHVPRVVAVLRRRGGGRRVVRHAAKVHAEPEPRAQLQGEGAPEAYFSSLASPASLVMMRTISISTTQPMQRTTHIARIDSEPFPPAAARSPRTFSTTARWSDGCRRTRTRCPCSRGFRRQGRGPPRAPVGQSRCSGDCRGLSKPTAA